MVEYTNRIPYHHRSTTQYSQLNNNQELSFSNVDLDRGGAKYRWNYGTGFSKPNGNAPIPYSNYIKTDDSHYNMPREIYDLPTYTVVNKRVEKSFDNPITPETTKLTVDPESTRGR